MLSNRDMILSRIGLLVAFVLIGAALLAWRLYVVQIADHDFYYSKARDKYRTTVTTRGKRGEVFDRNGNLLVGNKPCDTIVVDPSLIPEEGDTAERLAAFFCNTLPVDYNTVLRRIKRRTYERKRPDGSTVEAAVRYAVIARQVDTAASSEVRARVRELFPELPRAAVYHEEEYLRYYPKGSLLANVLGFTSYANGQDVAVLGVESSFNRHMVPSSGTVRYEHDLAGRRLPYGEREITQEEKDGLNIFLTIDEALQSIVEEEMDKMVAEFRPKSACIIMADPHTGKLLALAQRPTFNPNQRTAEVMKNPDTWRLLFIENTFEPGSIMKALSISIALDEGVVTPDTIFDAEGGLWYYLGKPLKDSSKRNLIPVSVGVQKSSNIVTAKIALQLGARKLYDGLKKFGIGEHTGIPLKPESRGLIRNVEKWDGLSITRVPIGYSVGVTPMQMVRAYCAIADNGNLRTIKLFDHAEDPAANEVIEPDPEVPVQIFKRPTTAREMTNMLKAVTKPGGTAKEAGVPGFEVAGKTGTSRKVINGHYAEGKYNSTFIGYIPADDPAFVLLVNLDEPKGAIYGGITAAPTFRAICERALPYLNVEPDPALLPEPKKR